MITPKEFVSMKEIARCLIQHVFENEDAFKARFITPNCRFDTKEYELERVHLSGYSLRVTIQFYNGSTHDMFLNLDDVYSWSVEVFEENS